MIGTKISKIAILALPLLAFVTLPSFAQLTYPGCAAVQTSDFAMVALARNSTDTSIKEPEKMALDLNAQGKVDVYFVQRYGKVRKYDGTAGGTALTLANFNFGTGTSLTDTNQVYSSSSEGLQGIALDPAFKTNHWIYLYFCMKSKWRVTRYTLNGNTLDLTTAKTILTFSHASFGQHMGSAIRFDWAGNLWMTVADDGGSNWPDNRTVLYQAANTNSYFGKILRVKPRAIPDNQAAPTPGVGSTYDIPAGNLFPEGTAKTLPEIYVMGTRNPYSIGMDSVRKAITWGDVGPDTYTAPTGITQWTEEFNLTAQPGNFGWPMWAGSQVPMPTAGWAGFTAQPPPAGGFGPTSAPVNNRSDNTGLTTLPAAQPAMIPYAKACAITGPVYYYNGSLASTVKFPPHFNGHWIIGDFNNEWIDVAELNPAGTAVLSRQRIVTAASTSNALDALMDLQIGPDGALYLVNYAGYRTTTAGTGIYRIEYRGTCLPTTTAMRKAAVKIDFAFDGAYLKMDQAGPHRIEVRSLTGRVEWLKNGTGAMRYDLRSVQAPGLHIISVTTPAGRSDRKFVR